ncbi:TPA: hypothetical protein ACJJ6I_001920, partial [Neisseria meningitidis]
MPSEPQMLFRRHFIIRPFESGDTICIQNCWIVWSGEEEMIMDQYYMELKNKLSNRPILLD